MLRLGLCCIFRNEPIKFRAATAAALKRLARNDARQRLASLCAENAAALLAALQYCAGHGIGCFRVNSQILPLKTHPELGYDVAELPDGRRIIQQFEACGAFARQAGLRSSLHPDQFVVLNSPRPEVVAASIAEIEYQAEAAEWIGADVINVHAGGAYGDKAAALQRFRASLARLSRAARRRLTVENDDKSFTPADLLPLCRTEAIPLVYDVHHHRCLPDGMREEETTQQALATWDREPLFHVSSPLHGWQGPHRTRHHDYIAVHDFPTCWMNLDVTVEVEAKAKELAVRRLAAALARRAQRPR